MELRVLEYFLAVAREQNITRAAEALHLTQPTLSRQMKELEAEFGKTLFLRGKRKLTLTEDGLYFRRRAEEIVSLARRTETEMKNADDTAAGELFIGAGETQAIGELARVVAELQRRYDGIRFHVISGDTADLTERLDKGLFDFCLLLGQIDRQKYDYLELPFRDRWGVLMQKGAPLSDRQAVGADDLMGRPLILSRQMPGNAEFVRWLGRPAETLHTVATYNLVTNAAMMAAQGMGYVLTLDGLVHAEGRGLAFVPLAPELTTGMALVWKKGRARSRTAEKFLEAFAASLAGREAKG